MTSPRSSSTFQARLVEALHTIRHAFLAHAIFAFFTTGLYDALATDVMSADALASRMHMREDRLTALLTYAANEGLLERRGSEFIAAPDLIELAPFRAWFDMFIGGYGSTLAGLDQLLSAESSAFGFRDVSLVGRGSSGISQYDTIPLLKSLTADLPAAPIIVDIGSGDASYLIELCRLMTDARCVALEPSAGGAAAARRHVANEGLEGRIEVRQCSAQGYLGDRHQGGADCYIAAFVLQEVLAQDGRGYVVEMLRRLAASRTGAQIIAIEANFDRHADLTSSFERAYYNPYFLVHALTQQRLLPREDWLAIFADAGLALVRSEHPSTEVDPTRIEEAYLLTMSA